MEYALFTNTVHTFSTPLLRENRHRAANRYATESSSDLERSAKEFYGRIRQNRRTCLRPQEKRNRTCKQDRQTKGAPGAMPFSQIRYILLAHRSSEKTDTGQRIDTPLNPLPTSKDLQKSFTVGFGKTGAPAYGRRRKGIGPANKIDRRRAPPERCNYDFGTFGGT